MTKLDDWGGGVKTKNLPTAAEKFADWKMVKKQKDGQLVEKVNQK